tara:strand:- start:373 stop:819 length:447 start_codon:yes stop_codon:yes gene_type:complete
MSEDKEIKNQSNKPKGLSIAGMVLGIVGLVFALAPCMHMIGLIVGVVGLILSAISMKKCNAGQADGKGMAIAGLATSIIAVVWAIYMIAFWSAVADETLEGLGKIGKGFKQLEEDLHDLDNYLEEDFENDMLELGKDLDKAIDALNSY